MLEREFEQRPVARPKPQANPVKRKAVEVGKPKGNAFNSENASRKHSRRRMK